MKHMLETTLIGLTVTFITACGSFPLAQPEGNTAAAGTPVEEATTEVVVVQPQSPLTPPTPAKDTGQRADTNIHNHRYATCRGGN